MHVEDLKHDLEVVERLHCKKGCFNPARVISVASSLPNNVHTSRSITLFDQYYIIGLQFQTEG